MALLISIIIPIYNESSIIEELCEKTIDSISYISESFEIICVDDGSTDDSLKKLINYHRQDSRLKVIALSRNFGQQAAIFAGLQSADGDYVGIMDGDLQDPPELFKKFYKKIQDGYDVVYAIRKKRKESLVKRFLYWLYYRLLAITSEIDIPLDSGDFSLFSRRVLDQMLTMPEQSMFIRGIRAWVGFKQVAVEYEREPRKAGASKYSNKKLKALAENGIFNFSYTPIKLLGRFGVLIMVVCLLYSLYTIYEKYFLGSTPKGFTTLIIAIFFFSGVQLVSMRILGEYIIRLYDEAKKRPLFCIKNRYFD